MSIITSTVHLLFVTTAISVLHDHSVWLLDVCCNL